MRGVTVGAEKGWGEGKESLCMGLIGRVLLSVFLHAVVVSHRTQSQEREANLRTRRGENRRW